MSYNFLDILVLLGSIQGFITSFLLLFGKKYASEKSLGWILLLLSLACLNLYLMNTIKKFSDLLIFLYYIVPLVIIMPIGPLLFQRTLKATNSTTKLSNIHFHAVWIDFFNNLVAIAYFLGLLIGIFEKSQIQMLSRFTESYNMYADIPRWISLTTYSLLSYQLIRKSRNKNVRFAKKPIFGFLAFQALWLIYLIPYLVPAISDSLLTIFNWYPLYLPLVFLIYWLGINALIDYKKTSTISIENNSYHDETLAVLTKLMQDEKAYLDPQLRLEKVVSLTSIPQKTISAVLNQTQHKSFNEFVNEYRVKAVKEGLLDPSKRHLTLTGIAFECGFNSQATFQRTFKELVGESPSQFRKRLLKA